MLNYFMNMLAAEGDTQAGGCGGNPTTTIIMVILIVVIFAVTIIMPMFTGKKRQKEANEMLESLTVGDEIMTRGGVLGTIVELKTHESGEKLMVIETGVGTEKTTMTFTVQALLINYTKTKQHQEQLAKQKAEREAAKNKGKDNSSEENSEAKQETSVEDTEKSDDENKKE